MPRLCLPLPLCKCTGAGLHLRAGGDGAVSELPCAEHCRYDHRWRFTLGCAVSATCRWRATRSWVCRWPWRRVCARALSPPFCRHVWAWRASWRASSYQHRPVHHQPCGHGLFLHVSLVKTDTVFSLAKRALAFGESGWYKLVVAAAVTVVACALLIGSWAPGWAFPSALPAITRPWCGPPPSTPAFTITVGLCISNAMTALSGAVLAQYQKISRYQPGHWHGSHRSGFADYRRNAVWPRRYVRQACWAVAGSVIYRFIVALALRANVPSECLKLISAVIVALAIAAPALKKNLALCAAAVPSARKEVQDPCLI